MSPFPSPESARIDDLSRKGVCTDVRVHGAIPHLPERSSTLQQQWSTSFPGTRGAAGLTGRADSGLASERAVYSTSDAKSASRERSPLRSVICALWGQN